MTAKPKKPARKGDKPKKKKSRELPVVQPAGKTESPPTPVSTDSDPLRKWREAREMEDEMAELFDEDRVVHRHGDAEPESD